MKTQFQPCRYSRNITGARLVIIASLLTFLPFRTIQAQNWDYTWVSTDGNPDGFSATIVLDSPANANGSPSDILSVSFFNDYASLGNSDVGSLFMRGTFSWNPQTITQAALGFSAFPSGLPAFGVGPNSISQVGADNWEVIDTGYWSGSGASVPEPSAWGLLGGGAAVVLLLCRHRKPARRRTVNASYTFGLARLAKWNGSAMTFELNDRLGSVRLARDASGNVIQSYNYDVFGARR